MTTPLRKLANEAASFELPVFSQALNDAADEIERLRAALRWAFEKIPTNHVADWPEDYLLLAIELDAPMPNVNEQLAPVPNYEAVFDPNGTLAGGRKKP